jgi:hypothetical protein
MANHYTYRVEWSTDAEQYMARCMEITGLLASAPISQQALAHIEAAVNEHLREMNDVFGGEPPTPLTSKTTADGSWYGRRAPCTRGSLWRPPSKVFRSTNGWRRRLADRKPDLDW